MFLISRHRLDLRTFLLSRTRYARAAGAHPPSHSVTKTKGCCPPVRFFDQQEHAPTVRILITNCSLLCLTYRMKTSMSAIVDSNVGTFFPAEASTNKKTNQMLIFHANSLIVRVQKKTRFSYGESGFQYFLHFLLLYSWCRLPESNWRPFHYE